MQIDPKGLEAAIAAVADSEGWNAEDMPITRRTAIAAVSAYLAATSPAGDLVARLEAVSTALANDRPYAAGVAREAAQSLRHQSTGVTEITDEMVERVARAICRHVPIDGSSAWNEPYGYDFDADYSDKERMIIRNIARAALSAQERG